MKTSTILIASLASVSLAQPHRRHVEWHQRRQDQVTEWQMAIVTETVYEIIDVATTSYFTESARTSSVAPVTTTAAPAATATPIIPPNGQFVESSTPVVAPDTPTVALAYVPAPSPDVVSPVDTLNSPAPTTSVYVAPPAPVTTEAPTPAPAPVAAPAPSPVAAAAAAAAPAAANTGDLTYYQVGLGSCGVDNTGQDNSVNLVAIDFTTMGTQSNGNPMCGKTITIWNGDKSTTALVVDKCMGCAAGSIDVSQKAFEELSPSGGLTEGRLHGVKWSFN